LTERTAVTTETISKNVRQAFEFQQKTTVWIGIGRTSPWPNEENVPDPPRTTQAIGEILGLVKPLPLKMVVPADDGEIEMFAQKFHALPMPYDINTLITDGARWVYVSAWLMYDEFPVAAYRQEGVYSGVVPDASVPPGATILLPGQVASYGLLEAITNRRKIQRRADQKEFIEFILEF